MTGKRRLSASVDAALLQAVEEAAAREAPTLSAWVNDALELKLEHDRKLASLADFIREYEEDHGEITAEEMHAAARSARARALTVRGAARPALRSSKQVRRKR
jgi:metal-responsive CopG/Arc/MetJ family transcriptional regulator